MTKFLTGCLPFPLCGSCLRQLAESKVGRLPLWRAPNRRQPKGVSVDLENLNSTGLSPTSKKLEPPSGPQSIQTNPKLGFSPGGSIFKRIRSCIINCLDTKPFKIVGKPLFGNTTLNPRTILPGAGKPHWAGQRPFAEGEPLIDLGPRRGLKLWTKICLTPRGRSAAR